MRPSTNLSQLVTKSSTFQSCEWLCTSLSIARLKVSNWKHMISNLKPYMKAAGRNPK